MISAPQACTFGQVLRVSLVSPGVARRIIHPIDEGRGPTLNPDLNGLLISTPFDGHPGDQGPDQTHHGNLKRTKHGYLRVPASDGPSRFLRSTTRRRPFHGPALSPGASCVGLATTSLWRSLLGAASVLRRSLQTSSGRQDPVAVCPRPTGRMGP